MSGLVLLVSTCNDGKYIEILLSWFGSNMNQLLMDSIRVV